MSEGLVRVPSVVDMDDEIFIKHLEARHGEDVSTVHLGVQDPDRAAKGLPHRLREGVMWRKFHEKMHELYDGRTDRAAGMYNHIHKEAQGD